MLNSDFEKLSELQTPLGPFDVGFCFGVDYLFRDMDLSFRYLRSVLKNEGHLFVSRNVFLDMPCYFGGKPIRCIDDLVQPNPLISLFMYQDQYLELLSRYFELGRVTQGSENYGANLAVGRHLLVECRVNHQKPITAKPILNPKRGAERVAALSGGI